MGFFSKLLGIEDEVVTQKTTSQSVAPKPKPVDDYTLGKKNLTKLLKMVYPYTTTKLVHHYDLLYIFKDIDDFSYAQGCVGSSDYIDFLYHCFNLNIDFENIDIENLKKRLYDKAEKYFCEIGSKYYISYNSTDFYSISLYAEQSLRNKDYDMELFTSCVTAVGVRSMVDDGEIVFSYAMILVFVLRTINVFCGALRVINLLQKDTEFSQVYNKLKNGNVENDVIVDKLCEMFYADMEDEFYFNGEASFKVFMAYIETVSLYNTLYNLFFTKDTTHNMPILKSKSLNNNVMELVQYMLSQTNFKNGDLDIDVTIINCIRYILEEKKTDFEEFESFFEGEEQYADLFKEVKKSISKLNKEKELNRILSGDISQETNKSKELYDFKNIKDGFEFEEYVGRLFKKLGYNVEQTKLSGDQGADLIIEKDGIKTVIQTKLYSQPVGNKAVQEVVGSIAYYKADAGAVVTNSTFTASAIELANKNNIELIDKDVLDSFIDTASKL